MAKADSTLADLLYRYTFRDKGVGSIMGPQLRNELVRARKFVLDDGMSAFMADLGWEAYLKKPERALQYLDELRIGARLPYATTWIEWNETALATRARKEYGSSMNPETCPKRTGWLLMQHPQLETGFMGLSFGQGAVHLGGGKFTDPEAGGLGISPMGFAWSVTDAPPPWPVLPAAEEFAALRKMPLSSMLTGISAYKGPVTVINPAPYINLPKDWPTVELRRMIIEQYGMMRYIFALLATLNDVPVRENKVVAAKGFFAKGRYRKFLDHSVVSLTVPADRYRAVARKVVMQARRRAHQVRGHWRLDWRFPGKATCEHQWTALPEATGQRCAVCGAHRLWIHEHQRGDASLGHVTHDYEVSHAS